MSVESKVGQAVELSKKRLLKANPKYEREFEVFSKIKVFNNPVVYGQYDKESQTIYINKKYVEVNDVSTVSRLLIRFFLFHYLDQEGHLSGQELNDALNDVYTANGLKTRRDHLSATGDLLKTNVECPHCHKQFHVSGARMKRLKEGSKFFCHDCFEDEHKYYWLKPIEEEGEEQ